MKRKPANTAEAAVQAAVNAAKPLPSVPKHVNLRTQDMPFWEGILRARARDEWTETDLVIAGQLARCQYDIERESQVLEEEGTVLKNDRGTMVANPRVSVLEQLARREMAIMRTLRMGGAAAGEARHVIQRRSLERQAGQTHAAIQEEEDLLA